MDLKKEVEAAVKRADDMDALDRKYGNITPKGLYWQTQTALLACSWGLSLFASGKTRKGIERMADSLVWLARAHKTDPVELVSRAPK